MTGVSSRLPLAARQIIEDEGNTVLFSTVSIWEVAIKAGLRRADFIVNPRRLRDKLIDNSYEELPVLGEHALAVVNLPNIHRDPFDRILIAQAFAEGIVLLTSDKTVARYGGLVQHI
jgi:PIN domain nuclease of toxin-antitoxin system